MSPHRSHPAPTPHASGGFRSALCLALALAAACGGAPPPPPGPPAVGVGEVPECVGIELSPDPSRCLDPVAAERAQSCLHAMTRKSFDLALAARKLSRARAEEASFEPAVGDGRAPGELFEHAGEEGESRLIAIGVGSAPPATVTALDDKGASRDVPVSLISALARDGAGTIHPIQLQPKVAEQHDYKVCDCAPVPDERAPPEHFWAYEIPGAARVGPAVAIPFELHAVTLTYVMNDEPICK
jgi:hypothetical protein